MCSVLCWNVINIYLYISHLCRWSQNELPEVGLVEVSLHTASSLIFVFFVIFQNDSSEVTYPVNVTKWVEDYGPVFTAKVSLSFYPRPVLAFGYCRCLRLCVCLSVCLSVCQSLACPRDNSGPIQARIAKFGPKMQKTLVKVPIVLGGNWPWPSRSNLTSKSEFTQFWACPDHNSLPIQAKITKFGPEVENSLVKVPIVLGGNWHRPSRSNLI